MKKIKNYISYIIDFFKLIIGKEISFSTFEILIYTIQSISKNNKLYEFLLKRYDTSLKFVDYQSAKFIASGGGDESLNLYRKIKKGNLILFEKIYRIESREFKNALYFYTHIYEKTTALGIDTPKLQYKFIGKKLAIMYYDFIEINPEENRKANFIFFKGIDDKMKKLNPKTICDLESFQIFTAASTYQRGKAKMIQDFTVNQRPLAKKAFTNLEAYFLKQPLYYQHIDLHHNNVINYQYLIDWDTSSYYPANYDFGTIAAWVVLEDIKDDRENYQLFVDKVLQLNDGKRSIHFEFSLLMHFVRFYPKSNFSKLFYHFYEECEKIVLKTIENKI